MLGIPLRSLLAGNIQTRASSGIQKSWNSTVNGCSKMLLIGAKLQVKKLRKNSVIETEVKAQGCIVSESRMSSTQQKSRRVTAGASSVNISLLLGHSITLRGVVIPANLTITARGISQESTISRTSNTKLCWLLKAAGAPFVDRLIQGRAIRTCISTTIMLPERFVEFCAGLAIRQWSAWKQSITGDFWPLSTCLASSGSSGTKRSSRSGAGLRPPGISP